MVAQRKEETEGGGGSRYPTRQSGVFIHFDVGISTFCGGLVGKFVVDGTVTEA